MICNYSNIIYMPTIGHPPTHLSTQAVGVALLHQFARDRFREENLTESLIEVAEQELGSEFYDIFSCDEDQDDAGENLDKEKSEDDTTRQQQQSQLVSSPILNGSSTNQSISTRSATGQGLDLSATSLGSQSNNTSGVVNINSSIGPLNSTAKPHDFSTDSTFHSINSSTRGNNSSRANDSNTSVADSNVTITNDHQQPNQNSSTNMTQGDSIYHSMNTTRHQEGKPIVSANNSTVNETNTHDTNRHKNPNVSPDICRTQSGPRIKPNLDEHLHESFNALGQTLRKLADDFAKSKERQRVRDQASRVGID